MLLRAVVVVLVQGKCRDAFGDGGCEFRKLAGGAEEGSNWRTIARRLLVASLARRPAPMIQRLAGTRSGCLS